MVHYFLAESGDVFYKFVEVILGKIYAGLLVLLDLLEYWLVVCIKLRLCLIQLSDGLSVVFLSDLDLMLGVQTVIHDLLYFLNGDVTLLLVE